MKTVGVAPGTVTLQLDGTGTCPPDPPWVYMTPPWNTAVRLTGAPRPVATAGAIVSQPYGTESELLGLRSVDELLPPPNPYPTRWDIIAAVGGGALLVALTIGYLASR